MRRAQGTWAQVEDSELDAERRRNSEDLHVSALMYLISNSTSTEILIRSVSSTWRDVLIDVAGYKCEIMSKQKSINRSLMLPFATRMWQRQTSWLISRTDIHGRSFHKTLNSSVFTDSIGSKLHESSWSHLSSGERSISILLVSIVAFCFEWKLTFARYWQWPENISWWATFQQGPTCR